MPGLTNSEVMKVVNRYIGVSMGYLGNFSYRTHAEFYPEYCEIDDIYPDEIPGTTRERFIHILNTVEPAKQARILRGVLERFPVGAEGAPATRTPELRAAIQEIIRRLEGASPVTSPSPRITSAVVERAIADAEALIQSQGATSGVDRVHTALHGYLRVVCDEAGITYASDSSLTALFKLLREGHPVFQDPGPRAREITQILRSSSAIMDALNPVRNTASVAHPNEDLLPAEEAMLVINIARTLLHYLDSKLSRPSSR